jgi:hypothetical protein
MFGGRGLLLDLPASTGHDAVSTSVSVEQPPNPTWKGIQVEVRAASLCCRSFVG